jgi:hypothetical protein
MPTITRDKRIKEGSVVKLIHKTYGGYLPIGSVGIVTAIIDSDNTYIVEFNDDERKLSYICDMLKDVEFVTADSPAVTKIMTSSITNHYVNMHKYWTKALRERMMSLRSSIYDSQQAIRNKLQDISNLTRLRNSLMRRAKHLNDNDNTIRYVEYLLRDRFKSIDILEKSLTIVAVTTPITIRFTPKNGAYVDVVMGSYEITIAEGIVSITNTDKKYIYRDTYPHPHISGVTPCFGSYTETIESLLEKGDFLVALDTIYSYLRSGTDAGSWYVSLYEWLPDKKDRCEKCFALLDKCKCKREDSEEEGEDVCPTCGEGRDDCNCVFCTMSGEYIREYDEICTGSPGRSRCNRWDIENGTCGG